MPSRSAFVAWRAAAAAFSIAAVAVGLVAAAVLAGCATAVPRRPALALIVEDVTHHRVLHREAVTAGETFTLAYVHSSERVPVRGLFRIEPDGSLTVVETAFGGFGPGLPELGPGDEWTIRDGMIVARSSTPALRELTLRVQPIARQRLLTSRATELDLARAMGESGGLVRIVVVVGRVRGRLPGVVADRAGGAGA